MLPFSFTPSMGAAEISHRCCFSFKEVFLCGSLKGKVTWVPRAVPRRSIMIGVTLQMSGTPAPPRKGAPGNVVPSAMVELPPCCLGSLCQLLLSGCALLSCMLSALMLPQTSCLIAAHVMGKLLNKAEACCVETANKSGLQGCDATGKHYITYKKNIRKMD